GIALFLRLLRARRELVAAFAGLGLGLVALRGFFPFSDLLFCRFIRVQQFGLLRRGPERRLADRLRLEERPEVRRLDVGGERGGLRALAERLGKREHQREHRDEERYTLVAAVFDVTVSCRHEVPLRMRLSGYFA